MSHSGPEQAFTSTDGAASRAGWAAPPPRKGFFTDTSICIGCKACEVACKEWNGIPQDGIFELLGSSYDNTGALGANTWRHVEFIEQSGHPLAQAAPAPAAALAEPSAPPVSLGMPSFSRPGEDADSEPTEFRWLMASNVCKHCTNAGCLDVCPTGALFRTEFGTVVVQDDICNGCGYCVGGCPFGVIDRRIRRPRTEEKRVDHASPSSSADDVVGSGPHPRGAQGGSPPLAQSVTARPVRESGIAQKCTLCYDRLQNDQVPACAQACPTTSIQFGDVDELRERAERRVADLQARGVMNAQLYAEDPDNGVGGAGAFFLLLDEPEVYGFPPDPVVTTADLPTMWKRAGMAAAGLVVAAAVAFVGRKP